MIITLSGSMKYKKLFDKYEHLLTKLGVTVLTPGYDNTIEPADEYQSIILELVHLDKIDLCDILLIVEEDNYIDTATVREILYARKKGKYILVASLLDLDKSITEADTEIHHNQIYFLVEEYKKRNSVKMPGSKLN